MNWKELYIKNGTHIIEKKDQWHAVFPVEPRQIKIQRSLLSSIERSENDLQLTLNLWSMVWTWISAMTIECRSGLDHQLTLKTDLNAIDVNKWKQRSAALSASSVGPETFYSHLIHWRFPYWLLVCQKAKVNYFKMFSLLHKVSERCRVLKAVPRESPISDLYCHDAPCATRLDFNEQMAEWPKVT